ncbi:MAG: hypothetical protein QXI19_05975 [Candidatus Caldarchaeum sp.]
MGDVDDLIQQVKEDKRVWQIQEGRGIQKIRYKHNFLHDAGVVYEREGLQVSRLYLNKKKQSRETEHQAQGLLAVLDHIETCPRAVTNRSIGRLLIETLLSFHQHA